MSATASAHCLVVRRLLVGRRGLGGAVDLDQQEPGGVVLLLEHVEPGDARLLQAVPRVLDAGGLEGLDPVGLHLDVDVDDQHGMVSPTLVRSRKTMLEGLPTAA